MLSGLVSSVLVYGLGRAYRPHLGAGLGALADFILWIALTVGLVRLFKRYEED